MPQKPKLKQNPNHKTLQFIIHNICMFHSLLAVRKIKDNYWKRLIKYEVRLNRKMIDSTGELGVYPLLNYLLLLIK